MTADTDMARLVLAIEAAGAKVVIVGDDRQLSAVGPGGALHQVLADHPQVVTTLTENRRQRDSAERDALLELRAGDLDQALAFYATHDRLTIGPARTQVLAALVTDWAADTAAGHDTFMLAWRRQSVADLNRIARAIARNRAWLTGPDMTTPAGRSYAVGDVVVTLAPNYRGQLVTSERATVLHVDPGARALTIRTSAGRAVTLSGDELDPDRLDHGYALTVHREQGATSDRTHYLAEGGGRELAYVALSRARDHTTVHAVADTLDQALDDIRNDWTRTNHDTWISPTTTAGTDPRHDPADIDRADTRRRLIAELQHLHALTPPEVSAELHATHVQLDTLHQQRAHLDAGTGPYANGPGGRIARQLRDLDAELRQARGALRSAKPWQRPHLRRQLVTLDNHRAAVLDERGLLITPEARRLDSAITSASNRAAQLRAEHAARTRQLEQLLADFDDTRSYADQPMTTSSTAANHDTVAEIRAALDALDAQRDHGVGQGHTAPDRRPAPGLGLDR